MGTIPEHIDEDENPPEGAVDSTPAPGQSIVVLAILAVACGSVSLFCLAGQRPLARADSLETWLFFGRQIVRDILLAFALLAAGTAIAWRVPWIGLFFERMIFRPRRGLFLVVAAGLAILSSGLFSYIVLDHMPHIQDEIAMLFQAKLLASGRLAAPAPALPEFFDCEFVINDGARWYSKYFLFQALPLVPGVWLGVPWLVHPALAGVAVWLTYLIGRDLLNEKIGRIGAVLMVISPFRVSLFGMMMSHASCLVVMALFGLAMIRLVKDPRRWGWAFVGGVILGMGLNSRPLTAVAMGAAIGLPALLAMPWRRVRWTTAVSFLVGMGLLVIVFVGYNRALTGHALLTPFNQWSKADRLGFGSDIGLEYWRAADRGHTLRKALFMDTYFNLDALGTNLIGWGHVTLFLLVLPIVRSRWPRRSWVLAAAVGSVVVAHFFHVSSGVLAGQARYWSEAMPMMVLLAVLGFVTVRAAMPVVCRWLGLTPSVRTARSACWLTATMLTIYSIPHAYVPIIDECVWQFWGQGPTVRDLARREKLSNALVFVKSGHYRTHFRGGVVDLYPCGFMLNDPDLSGPVVYARDLGDERNAALIERFHGRSVYRIDPSAGEDISFVPVLPVAQPGH